MQRKRVVCPLFFVFVLVEDDKVSISLGAAWRQRDLFVQLVRREVVGRYRGSALGMLWAFVTPLLMLGVYTFVFVGIFQMRWAGAENGGGMAYGMRLFAGLIVFNLFAEVVSRAPGSILEQPNLVKRVVFPLELQAQVALTAALFHFAVSAALLLLATGLWLGWSASMLLLPLAVLPLLPLLLGLAWLLSALGVFVRDLGQFIGLAVSLLLFLSPVFYGVERLPAAVQPWMAVNPLAWPIEHVRRAVFGGTAFDWPAWGLSLALGLLVAALGAWVFARLRGGFADVV